MTTYVKVLVTWALLCFAGFLTTSSYGESYECKNKHGEMVWSDKPCDSDSFEIKEMDIRDLQLKDVEKEVTSTAKSWIAAIIEEIYKLIYQIEARLNKPPTSSSESLETIIFECKGKKTCGEMFSCDEAKYYFDNCPNTEMTDEDLDGIPCEHLWCQ